LCAHLACMLSPTAAIYALPRHDALPISLQRAVGPRTRRALVVFTGALILVGCGIFIVGGWRQTSINLGNTYPVLGISYAWLYGRSEEHTSELQSRENLVCRLLLEIKKAQ